MPVGEQGTAPAPEVDLTDPDREMHRKQDNRRRGQLGWSGEQSWGHEGAAQETGRQGVGRQLIMGSEWRSECVDGCAVGHHPESDWPS